MMSVTTESLVDDSSDSTPSSESDLRDRASAERIIQGSEVERTLNFLHEPGSCREIRVLGVPGKGKPHTASGYFTSVPEAVAAVLHGSGGLHHQRESMSL